MGASVLETHNPLAMSLEMLLTALIATALIVGATVDYFRSLRLNEKSVARKTWDWIKNLADILWGLG